MRPILAVLILWLSIMSLIPARQAAAATVAPELPAYTIAPDVITTVVVRLEDANNVYGIDVRAAFDPALVEVVDADLAADGIQLEPGRFPQPDFVALNRVDPQAGTLRYAVTQVNPTLPANGDGVVFTVRLRGLGLAGSGEFRIDLVEMSDRNGQLLPVETASATLDVIGEEAGPVDAQPTGVAIAPTADPQSGAATPPPSQVASPDAGPTIVQPTATIAPEATATLLQTESSTTTAPPIAEPVENNAESDDVVDSPPAGETPASVDAVDTPQAASGADVPRSTASGPVPTAVIADDSPDTRAASDAVAESNDQGASAQEMAATAPPDIAVIGENTAADLDEASVAEQQELDRFPTSAALAVVGLMLVAGAAFVLLARRSS